MTNTYWVNLEKIPQEELEKHRGKWIGIHPDGTRVVASHEDLAELTRCIEKAGEDPEQVVISGVLREGDSMPFGGVELD